LTSSHSRSGTPAIRAILIATLAIGASEPCPAQVLRGTVRVSGSDRAVADARIAAVDSAGTLLHEVVSDSNGRFTLRLSTSLPFRIEARKIGVEPSFSAYMRAKPADTLDLEIGIPTDVADLPKVEVAGTPTRSSNEIAYEDALRHGWKVYAPDRVARLRERYRDFTDMLRALQVEGIRINRSGDCVQNTHFNNRCLVYVIDGVPAGPYLMVQPSDIYFFAVVSATESAVRWGNRAPWGAIVIYTRMNGDRAKP
jgi:hypothetical protein